MSDCPRCLARGVPAHFGSAPKCAFRLGHFEIGGHNWQCATANGLRDLLDDVADQQTEEGGLRRKFGVWCFKARIDDESVGLIHIDDGADWVHLGWYKDRGATQMVTDNYGKPLALEAAERILSLAESKGWGNA